MSFRVLTLVLLAFFAVPLQVAHASIPSTVSMAFDTDLGTIRDNDELQAWQFESEFYNADKAVAFSNEIGNKRSLCVLITEFGDGNTQQNDNGISRQEIKSVLGPDNVWALDVSRPFSVEYTIRFYIDDNFSVEDVKGWYHLMQLKFQRCKATAVPLATLGVKDDKMGFYIKPTLVADQEFYPVRGVPTKDWVTAKIELTPSTLKASIGDTELDTIDIELPWGGCKLLRVKLGQYMLGTARNNRVCYSTLTKTQQN